MDDKHPFGASQHQKVLVVDDAVAFSGGIDLSKWRWDTPEHVINDKRRVDPDGKPYPPFHDVQMLVDGDAAAALGELARKRWLRATEEEIERRTRDPATHPWPASLQPLMHDVPVAIARTLADYAGKKGVREVERLYLDSIAAAERFIYIENQYLTAHCIAEALAQRLRQSDGPEVVIVMPEKTGGWLEQHIMDVLRSRLVNQLREADHSQRQVCCAACRNHRRTSGCTAAPRAGRRRQVHTHARARTRAHLQDSALPAAAKRVGRAAAAAALRVVQWLVWAHAAPRHGCVTGCGQGWRAHRPACRARWTAHPNLSAPASAWRVFVVVFLDPALARPVTAVCWAQGAPATLPRRHAQQLIPRTVVCVRPLCLWTMPATRSLPPSKERPSSSHFSAPRLLNSC